jgi:adenylate cyclase
MRRARVLKTISSLIAAGLLTFVALGCGGLDPLYTIRNAINDTLYQREGVPSEEIVIFGIDDRSIEVFGAYPWTRDKMAAALDALNADPDHRPAVIGVDVVYSGPSSEPEYDEALAEAAGRCGNVVLGCFAAFGTRLVTREDGSFYMDDFAVLDWEAPYEPLTDAGALTGSVNGMLDGDGILRSAFTQITLPDGSVIPAFSKAVYREYAEYNGLTENIPVTDGKNAFYVPFNSKPGNVAQVYSIADLILGETGPADLNLSGKAVLIGPYAMGLQDHFYTAVDHAETMYGIEYQANILLAYINGSFKTVASHNAQTAILFVFTFALLMFLLDRPIAAASAAWIGVSGASVLGAYTLYKLGCVVEALGVPLTATASYIITVAVNYFQAAAARRQIIDTFKRYVDPGIVKELIKQDPEVLGLGGKLTEIAVLFVDVRGFTPLSESTDPPTVVEILNRYLTMTSECIMRYGGTLDKFVGDCTMAIWGAPMPTDDYVYKACRAAMDMAEASEGMSKELFEKYGKEVGFGIGVHCGPAVVGNIGSTQRMDYTAIGDTVNTAARLEANAPAGCVYISRDIADALGNRGITTSLGDSVKLKGKADSFEVLILDDLRQSASLRLPPEGFERGIRV